MSPREVYIQKLEYELQRAQLKIAWLESELRRKRMEQLGPRSETLSDLQLELLLDEEPGTTLDEVEAEAAREPIAAAPASGSDERRNRRPHPGRQKLPEHLERVEEVIACTERHCAHCGEETAVIGYDETELLERVPARYFVRVSKREKRACRRCTNGKHNGSGKATVMMAPLAPRIIEKGIASDGVVVDTVIAKYCDHLPLYRQALVWEREAGVEMSRATLDGWVMRVGEMLLPVVDAMRADLLKASYLQADETTVLVQMRDKRGADHQAYLWQYGKPGGETVFDFQMGRGREGPAKFLGQWEGILQTDGYVAYTQGIGGKKLVHVGCWAHARRKFVDAVKVNPKDGRAIQMVLRMDALFVVDREARKQGLNAEERGALRRQHSQSWLDEIKEECQKLRSETLPASQMGRALNYTLNHWQKLKGCLDHAEVELSNNLAENSMRPVALGRKNWLHVGSAKSGPKVAAIMSVIESCRRLGIPAKDYLLAVLPGLEYRKTSEIADFTPARWAARARR